MLAPLQKLRSVRLIAARAPLERLVRLGTDGYPPAVCRRLMILNVIAYLIAIFTLEYIVEYLLVDARAFLPVILINVVIMAAAIAVPFMHRFGEMAGGLLIATVELIGIFALSSYVGSPAGLHIQYIVGAAMPFFVFGIHRFWLIAGLVLLCFAFHIAVWLLFPTPSPAFAANPRFLGSLYVSAAITTFALTGAMMFYAFRLADHAQGETDRLLRRMLPDAVVDRLRDEPGVTIADSFDDASVLFADITGFVAIARALGPVRTVELLNRIVSAFDALADRHGVEKIKTIGDAYMAVAGAPDPVADHAVRLARLALDMLDVIERTSRDIGQPLAVRIAIASGPLMAGVIGQRRTSYDVWGDTVNLAARLERLGVAGRVQVSARTKTALEPRMQLEPRGEIDVRGLGPQEVWLLIGPR